MAKVICKKNPDQIMITISGDIGLQHVPKLQQFLASTVGMPYNLCIIDMQKVSEIDFSFAELLLSFTKNMGRENKSVRLIPLRSNHPVSEYFKMVGISDAFSYTEQGHYEL